MSTQTGLRLVEVVDAETQPIDRRGATRHVLGGRVTALSAPHSAEDCGRRICSLELLNMSDSGMGAICQDPLPVHATVTVFFPPHGPEHGFDLHGRVVRARSRPDGRHDLGIRFDQQQQAA